jgi:predicted transcriptional regulator
MKNRNVGYLIIGIAIVIGTIILIFNIALKNIVGQTCSHGGTCTMYDTIAAQTWLSIAIAGVILVIGLFLIFTKEETKIITKIKKQKIHVEKKNKPIDYTKLNKDEKIIIKNIEDANGTIFQSDLVEKSGFSKVKVSRLLDKIEGRQLIERKRRGMTNVVVLK